jgi:hypothetical protein
MGVVVIGGGGGGTPPGRASLSVDGNEIVSEEGQSIAIFPNTPKGRKDCIRYLKMLDRETNQEE